MKIACLVFLVLTSIGCNKIPTEVFRAYHDAVGAEFARYVRDDPILTAEQKAMRVQAVDSMERLLQEAEK